MDYKSQNNEAQVVCEYFSGMSGHLLSLGENDGITFSNSYNLIELGWSAVLVEPSQLAFVRMEALYKDNMAVLAVNCGIGTESKMAAFYEPEDTLLATTDRRLLDKWAHVKRCTEKEVMLYSWVDFMQTIVPNDRFDFISIDCEGMDLAILKQIDLAAVGCSCICIEHGGDRAAYLEMVAHCSLFGLNNQLLYNGENAIMAK